MNGINLDPGLRQSFNQQTHQRLLAESTQARMAKSVKTEDPAPRKVRLYSRIEKIKDIGQVIRETGSTIMTIMRTENGPLKI